jgi:hypothetical protein
MHATHDAAKSVTAAFTQQASEQTLDAKIKKAFASDFVGERNATPAKSCLVTATSEGSPTTQDAVKAVVRPRSS